MSARVTDGTVGTLKAAFAAALQAHGVTMASLEAAELVACALGIPKGELLLRAAEPLSPEAAAQAWRLLNRRLADEPLAYILGQWDFCGLTLSVTPDVLIPRTDTELLAALTWQTADELPSPTVLDLCCGSGCVGLAVKAHVPKAIVTLCDVSTAALAVARCNAEALGLEVQVQQCDVLQAIPDGVYDAVACNPPYIMQSDLHGLDASVRDYEPHLALDGGDDGLNFYRRLTDIADTLLAPHGRLLLECGEGQAHAIATLFAAWRCDIISDTQGIDRVLILQR